MLYYADEIRDKNGFVYSVDMVRQRFELPYDKNRQNDMLQHFQADHRTDIEIYPVCLKTGKYRNMIVIDYGTSTMTLGLGYNGFSSEQTCNCFVEYNPNKVKNGKKKQWIEDMAYIKTCCDSLELKRFDLAIDLPYGREEIMMFPQGKGAKKYTLERYTAENKTETLGIRSSDGYTKLYNKAIEAKCDMDAVKLEKLTRLEITSDSWSSLHILSLLPELWLKTGQLAIVPDIRPTTRVLVDLLRQQEEPERYINELDARTAEKIKPLVATKRLEIDAECIKSICDLVLHQYSGVKLIR